jgi:rRNA maturation endonuclease Nob1
MGMEIFKKHKFKGELISTSAKSGKNVEKAFQMLGREILNNSLKKCVNCGNYYPLEQKFCQFCGTKNE